MQSEKETVYREKACWVLHLFDDTEKVKLVEINNKMLNWLTKNEQSK